MSEYFKNPLGRHMARHDLESWLSEGVFIRTKIRVNYTLVTISEKSGLNLPCHKFSCNEEIKGEYLFDF
jgi:hypothetical protein